MQRRGFIGKSTVLAIVLDAVDTAQLNQPVVVFTFDNAGLMAGVTLGAIKIALKPNP